MLFTYVDLHAAILLSAVLQALMCSKEVISVAVKTAASLASEAVVGVGSVGIIGDHRHVLFVDSKAGDVRSRKHRKLRHVPPLLLHRFHELSVHGH